jgi:hypothetical protein
MLRHSAIAGALAAAFAAGAQTPSILIEACNTIQDQDKRLECLKAATQAAPATSKDDALANAFLGLHGKIEVGLSLVEYQSALASLGQALAIYTKDAPQSKADAIDKYRQALDTHKDAATFWAAAIRFYARRDNGLAYAGGLPIDLVGLRWMVEKHSLPTGRSDILGIHVGVPTDQGRITMWTKAKKLAAEADALLKSPPPARAGQYSS